MSYKLVDRILGADAGGLNATDKLVLLVFARRANDDGTRAYPSRETIARLVGVTPRNVTRSIARLKDAGALIPAGSHKLANGKFMPVYRVNSGWTPASTVDASVHPGDDLGGQIEHVWVDKSDSGWTNNDILGGRQCPPTQSGTQSLRLSPSYIQSEDLYSSGQRAREDEDYRDAAFSDAVPSAQSPHGSDPDDPWDLPIDDDPPIVSIYQDGRLLGQTNRREAIDNARRLGYEIRP